MTGYQRRSIWYKLHVGGQHCLAVAHHFPKLMVMANKLVLLVDFGRFSKLKFLKSPNKTNFCWNPTPLENEARQPNPVAYQLVSYTKSNVFDSPSFFIICFFELHLSHLADF